MPTQTYKVTVDETGNRECHNSQGQLHRTDGPAIEWADGTREWWLNGQLHRTDGPAYEGANGSRVWWLNGQLHRTDGPAIELADGSRVWWLNGQLHRTDGPAIEWADGTREWYKNGKQLTEQQFHKQTQAPCAGKTVQIDGIKYQLTAI
jgi:hypothetical protein